MIQINQLIQQCFQAFQQQNYAFVVNNLSKIFDKIPFHRDVYFIYARSLRAVGNTKLSEDIFKQSLKNIPSDERALCALGNLKLATEAYKESIELFNSALKVNSQQFDALYNLARAYTLVNEPELAEKHFLKALSVRSNHEGSILGILNCLQQKKQFLEAINFVSINLSGELPLSIKLKLAELHKLCGNKKSCYEMHELACEQYPEAQVVEQAYIHSLIYFGDVALAFPKLKKEMNREQLSDDIIELYWQAWWQLEGEEAIQPFAKEVIQQQRPEVAFNFLSRLVKLKKYQLVVSLCEKLKPILESDARFAISYSISIREIGDIQAALSKLKSARNTYPSNNKVLYEYIITLLCLKEFSLAYKACKELLENDSRQLGHWALYSTYLRLAGEEEEYATLCDYKRLVKVYDLAEHVKSFESVEFNQQLLEQLEIVHTQNKQPVEQSVQHGRQTIGQLFDLTFPVIQKFRDVVLEVVNKHIQQFEQDDNHIHLKYMDKAFDFSGSWSVDLKSKGFHQNHYHSEGWISGPYYVVVPEAVSNNGQGWLKLGQPELSRWITLEPDFYVKPKPGCLVLFPSYMWHGTTPFLTEERRVTVAFDLAPRLNND